MVVMLVVAVVVVVIDCVVSPSGTGGGVDRLVAALRT